MKARLKSLRLSLYQALYTWALERWNRELNQTDYRRPDGKLSNHALMRYAERFDGYDFDKATKTIMSEEAKEKIKYIGGNGKFSMNGIFYIVKNGNIVTLAKAEGVKSHLTYQPVDGDSERGRSWSF
jgi:hypothetical protein